MSARSLVLVAASLCVGGLAALVYFHDSDLVLLKEYLDHPFALGALACLLMAWAAAGLRRRWLRVAFDSVRWTGPSSIEIGVADGRTLPVALDRASGKPQATAALNC
ncbi:hypothetical protein [Nonomuraea sp. NPDC050643]|uniref:hypothetical protein n=1 Tax=Nonomuraea sp. NPDC050643 TaxID=3155660 RepID=UPI0033E92F3C